MGHALLPLTSIEYIESAISTGAFFFIIKARNKSIIIKRVDEAKRCFKEGDHIAVQRSGYSHHGIYDGNGYVYEYNDYIVRYVSLHDFANSSDVYEFKEAAAYSPSEIVRRASSRLGEDKYNIAFNNCQNFATWCRCG